VRNCGYRRLLLAPLTKSLFPGRRSFIIQPFLLETACGIDLAGQKRESGDGTVPVFAVFGIWRFGAGATKDGMVLQANIRLRCGATPSPPQNQGTRTTFWRRLLWAASSSSAGRLRRGRVGEELGGGRRRLAVQPSRSRARARSRAVAQSKKRAGEELGGGQRRRADPARGRGGWPVGALASRPHAGE
jgi:hypothetical protein